MMGGNDINPSIRQPTPKPSLVGLSKLSATGDVHAKPIKVNVLTFNHADDHPAERLQVASILPHNVTLTQKIIQRIIESGSGSHFSAVECGNFPA
jgi:hypothetical protein